jgi:hypothetical protein
MAQAGAAAVSAGFETPSEVDGGAKGLDGDERVVATMLGSQGKQPC